MRVASALERIGTRTIASLEGLGRFVILAGRVLRLIATGAVHGRNTFQQMAFIGVESLPIALITALSIGMVFTLQISNEFIRFGATSVIGGVSTIALTRELIPTLTGVVIAGRVGAAIAAELGSMKVTEQIDALTALATDPLYYLAVPRVIACAVMLPLLALLGDAVAIFGGYAVAVAVKGVTPQLFINSLQDLVVPADILRGLVKAGFFGMVVGLIGSHQGLSTTAGARGVGKATTDSVVLSLITIFVSNYFLSALLFPGAGK
ncbi:putative phospholipid ABC transporter permease protein MlaE [compost metagenome]